jgi:hypothetical protein
MQMITMKCILQYECSIRSILRIEVDKQEANPTTHHPNSRIGARKHQWKELEPSAEEHAMEQGTISN